MHEAVAGIGRRIAGRLARKIDLGDPDLFQRAKLASGRAAVLVAVHPDLQLAPALIERVQLAVAVGVPTLQTFKIGLGAFLVLDEGDFR
ncbi:hypothetical protein D3C71_1607120 [compost metagenome]